MFKYPSNCTEYGLHTININGVIERTPGQHYINTCVAVRKTNIIPFLISLIQFALLVLRFECTAQKLLYL